MLFFFELNYIDMLIISVTLTGLLFGSFINNLLWQLRAQEAKTPAKKTITKKHKRSVCGQCGHQLSAKDLLPVVSWLSLKGRCRYCRKPLSIQYPLIELLTAGLFALSAAAWMPLTSGLEYFQLGGWLLILSGLIIMAIYDARWMILPHQVMAAVAALAVVLSLISAWTSHNWGQLYSQLLSALGWGGGFYLLYALGRGRWMGGGDVKLAALMGFLLGGAKTLLAMFIGFSSAAIFSLVLIASGVLSRKDLIPFGPFLILGTLLSMLYGSQLLDHYINYFTL